MSINSGITGESSLPAVFERTAAAFPLKPALCSRAAELSYAQLNRTANRLAHALLARGLAPDARIAVLMQHDLPQIVALLGVLKAGRIVTVLNPTHPAARLRELIDDAEATLLVADSDNERVALDITGPICTMARYDELVTHAATHNPVAAIQPQQAAALVYTSGSTGRPKAVVQTHRQLWRNAGIHTEAMAYSAADRLPLFGSVSGGQGLTMVFCAFLNGAALCPFPVTVKGVTGLADWMADLGITVYASSASIFRNFLKTVDGSFKFANVRAVRLSSEPATSDDFQLFQRHFPADCIFVHTLSSSETCNIAWSRRSIHDSVPRGRLPIGLPSRGQEVILLGASGEPVPSGSIGEIAVKSRYVAAGYWRNETATSEKFSPLLDVHGTRMVRTGDLGRINAEGLLEFIGRADDRIKLRGNRIELAEIENALQRVAGVQRAVVEAIARIGDEPLLVAFVKQEPGRCWSAAAMRRALREAVPDHMVPSQFVAMQDFPISPTGKIDRDTLRQWDLSSTAPHLDEPPRTDMEQLLAAMWREAFERDRIGRHDNFFDLGGDSLIAAVMSARIHDARGLDVELATFFDYPILNELAQELETRRHAGGQAPSAEPAAERPTEFPLTFNQEAFGALARSRAASLTVSRCSRITGPLDIAALEGSIAELVRRHEMLRTTLADRDGRMVQIVHPASETLLDRHDFSGHSDPEAQAREVWKLEQSRVFDLTQCPLIRFTVVRLHRDEHWLLYTGHGVLFDGLSLTMFFKELGQLYDARTLVDKRPSLPWPAAQYGNYALWQSEVFRPNGQRYQESVMWWIKEILTASYPADPAYCRALLWCMAVLRPKSRLLKQVIGMLLRSILMAPLPPRSELPFNRSVAVKDIDPSAGIIPWGLPPDVSGALNRLGRQEHASDYVTRFAAYIAALAAETDDPNVVLYTSLSNRARPATQGVFGCCATPAIVVFRCDTNRTFRQLLGSVRDRLRAMQRHADIPYHRIHREMRAWKIKMPQGRAILSSAWTHPVIRAGDVEIAGLPDRFVTAPPFVFDTKLDLVNESDNCTVLFDAQCYDPQKVRDFVDRFRSLLELVSKTPDMRLCDAIDAIKVR